MTATLEAGKILRISHVNRESTRPDVMEFPTLECIQLTVATKNGTEDLFVDYFYFNRYDPQVGGYFLRYNDGWCGYVSEEVYKRRFTEDTYGDKADSAKYQQDSALTATAAGIANERINRNAKRSTR